MNRPDTNDELHNADLQPGFEPLRMGFALFALLLGAAAAMQF